MHVRHGEPLALEEGGDDVVRELVVVVVLARILVVLAQVSEKDVRTPVGQDPGERLGALLVGEVPSVAQDPAQVGVVGGVARIGELSADRRLVVVRLQNDGVHAPKTPEHLLGDGPEVGDDRDTGLMVVQEVGDRTPILRESVRRVERLDLDVPDPFGDWTGLGEPLPGGRATAPRQGVRRGGVAEDRDPEARVQRSGRAVVVGVGVGDQDAVEPRRIDADRGQARGDIASGRARIDE